MLLILVKLHTSVLWSRFPIKHPDATRQIDPSSKAASAAPHQGLPVSEINMGGLLLAQAGKADPVTARVYVLFFNRL